MSYVPSYTEWLLQCDMEPAYRYHRRVLKLLQWRCPPDRWWLKTPAHMLSIDALDAVYPDARFVMTHRDVGQGAALGVLSVQHPGHHADANIQTRWPSAPTTARSGELRSSG